MPLPITRNRMHPLATSQHAGPPAGLTCSSVNPILGHVSWMAQILREALLAWPSSSWTSCSCRTRSHIGASMPHDFLVRLVGGGSVCMLGLTACATQVLHWASALAPGATPARGRAVLGEPQERQFRGNQEAWQYCKTG